jgi:DNA ligase-1
VAERDVKAFADLYDALDRTTSTNAKVAAIVEYLRSAPAADAAWALFVLTGRRLKRLLPSRLLHAWTLELTGLPEWLVKESYAAVGDQAEAIALLLDRRLHPNAPKTRVGDPGLVPRVADDVARSAPQPESNARLPFAEAPEGAEHTDVAVLSLAEWMERRILPLREVDDATRRVRVITWWSQLDRRELFLLNKLLTGEFRVGVSHTLVVRAVAQLTGLSTATLEHRLMGAWEPSADTFTILIAPDGPADDPSRPYPFCLASPLNDPVETLGPREEWLVEWKWDGIRAQLIRRDGRVFLWSRGEELITERFPEIATAAHGLPDGVVLDGEVLAFRDGRPRPFADLQQRISRQQRVHETATDVPVVFVAYDLLEEGRHDIRELPLRDRRARVLAVLNAAAVAGVPPVLRPSEEIAADTWETLASLRAESRSRHVEGLMLKRWSSLYRPGRRRGDWWKWKIDPFTIDAVLIYAQPGTGRRASLFTDYTFAVWRDKELVPVAKAYSGLSDEEIDELDRWIRRHTTERFGPVSAVEPVHVFELGFEGIAPSTRHKSGVAVRFPRILRWRRDKRAAEADTLATLERLLR